MMKKCCNTIQRNKAANLPSPVHPEIVEGNERPFARPSRCLRTGFDRLSANGVWNICRREWYYYLLIVSAVLFAATSKSACIDEIQNKQPQPFDHTLPLNKWTKSELSTLASLLEEQQHWILVADAIANEIPIQQLDYLINFNRQLATLAAQEFMARHDSQFEQLGVSDEQKTKGLNLFFGLYICSRRNNTGEQATRFKQFIGILSRFSDVSLLEPLRTLTNVILAEKNVPNVKIAQRFILEYNEIVLKLDKAISTFMSTKDATKKQFEAIIDELILLASPTDAPPCNVFTQLALATTKVSPQAADKLFQNMQTSKRCNRHELLTSLNPLLVELDSKKTTPIIEKLRPEQLRELASLLDQQARLMKALENLCDLTTAHVNSKIDDTCAQLCDIAFQSQTAKSNPDQTGMSSAQAAATEQCDSDGNFGLEKIFSFLEKHQYKELDPLQKVLQMYEVLKKTYGTIQFNLNLLHDTVIADKIFDQSCEILKLHDMIYKETNDLYNKIMAKLAKLKPAVYWRKSVLASEYRCLPQKYGYEQRPQIPLAPLGNDPLSCHAMQEYFMLNEPSHPISFCRNLPSNGKSPVACSFTID